jgi:hypothetical protein
MPVLSPTPAQPILLASDHRGGPLEHRDVHDVAALAVLEPIGVAQPRVWMTQRAGRRPVVVATACPTGRPRP